MSYEFKIVRYEKRRDGTLLFHTETTVDQSKIAVANEAGLRKVRNVLAMRSDARSNGLEPRGFTYLFVVSWIKHPRGPKQKLFSYEARELWDSRVKERVA